MYSRRHSLALSLLLLVPRAAPAQQPRLDYTIDLNHRADDLFRVTLAVQGLTPENAVYQFAATAPGTYQIMNVGRFVRGFEAADASGKPVPVEQVSVNQWKLSDPARVRTIRYRVAETWDTPVDQDPIYLMCGTSIERDHVLINPHDVIGYPTGLQANPIHLRLSYPKEWKVGTALTPGKDGSYTAESFDQLVDSPILLGRLTRARVMVTGVPVEIYTYSKHDLIRSPQLLAAMNGMLQAAGRFLGKLPVDRYTFLYHFEDKPAGAWEHSLSSEYVLKEGTFSDSVGRFVTDIAAHEFFHVVTPLNIHSEIIEHFNFVTPVPSQHLWLYEATTEWAAHIMQLRSGLKSPDEYLQTIIKKMNFDRKLYDSTYSLRELALTSYSDSGQKQYGNIYMRGRGHLRAARHPPSGALEGPAGAAGTDQGSGSSLRQAASVSRVHFRGYACRHDVPRGARLLQPLHLGLGEAAGQGVLRQARHPPDRGRDGCAGAVRDRSQAHARPAPPARCLAGPQPKAAKFEW